MAAALGFSDLYKLASIYVIHSTDYLYYTLSYLRAKQKLSSTVAAFAFVPFNSV